MHSACVRTGRRDALLANQRFLGLSDVYVSEYFKIEDPLYDAWFIHLGFLTGRRATLYADNVR